MTRIIAFDLDGTLIDSLPNISQALNTTLTHFNIAPKSADEIRLMVGFGAKVLIEKATNNAHNCDQILVFYSATLLKLSHNINFFEGMRELIDELQKTRVVAVITNKPHDSACAILKDIKIQVIGVRDGINPKPACDMIEYLREQHGKNADITIVGDTEVDSETAFNSKCKCILVSWGFRTIEELQQLGYPIVHNVNELKSHLK